jgi:hypothetical protein
MDVQRVALTGEEMAVQTLWLIGFANDPRFDVLSPDGQRSVQAGIQRFIEDISGDRPELSLNETKDCHQFIQTGVRAMLRGEAWYCRIEVEYCLSLLKGGHLEIGPGVPRGNLSLFRQRVLETLSAVKDRIRHCPRQGCVKIFIRTGKQTYCTQQCSAKARLWKHRAKRKRMTDETQQESNPGRS